MIDFFHLCDIGPFTQGDQKVFLQGRGKTINHAFRHPVSKKRLLRGPEEEEGGGGEGGKEEEEQEGN